MPISSASPTPARPRGSQQQLQAYVNRYPEVITKAVLDALPIQFQESGSALRWVSPLADEDYREYRDADFLRRVDLGQFARELAEFWPGRGPCWDALAMIDVVSPRGATILVEAKSHIPEI